MEKAFCGPLSAVFRFPSSTVKLQMARATVRHLALSARATSLLPMLDAMAAVKLNIALATDAHSFLALDVSLGSIRRAPLTTRLCTLRAN